MGMTMTQKILAAHAGLESVVAGQLIEADLDMVLANDITGPVAIHEVEKLNKKTVFDKDKIDILQLFYSILIYINMMVYWNFRLQEKLRKVY